MRFDALNTAFASPLGLARPLPLAGTRVLALPPFGGLVPPLLMLLMLPAPPELLPALPLALALAVPLALNGLLHVAGARALAFGLPWAGSCRRCCCWRHWRRPRHPRRPRRPHRQ